MSLVFFGIGVRFSANNTICNNREDENKNTNPMLRYIHVFCGEVRLMLMQGTNQVQNQLTTFGQLNGNIRPTCDISRNNIKHVTRRENMEQKIINLRRPSSGSGNSAN